MNPKVDFFFNKTDKWQEELKAMRRIALDCHLPEDLKWGCPCYTHEGSNIVLIHAFKDYCAYLFFKGALMKDPNGILIRQTENVQSARQVRFTSLQQIKKLAPVLRNYILQAVEVEESGEKVALKKTADFPIPEELQTKFDETPELKTAFEALTRAGKGLIYFTLPRPNNRRPAYRG